MVWHPSDVGTEWCWYRVMIAQSAIIVKENWEEN